MAEDRVFRVDVASGTVGERRRTPQGGLVVNANLTRTGVFTYRSADGSARRELRHPDDVFSHESRASYPLAPVTVDHPGRVDTRNWKAHAVGTHGPELPRPSGDFLAGELHLQHQDAIERAEKGDLREVSCGYTCDVDNTPGVYMGQPYDAAQRNIRINHIAIGPKGWGRMGPETRMHLDAKTAISQDADWNEEDHPRDEGGKFSSGGGGGGSSKSASSEGGHSLSQRAKDWLTGIGAQAKLLFTDHAARKVILGNAAKAVREFPRHYVEHKIEEFKKDVGHAKNVGAGLAALAKGEKPTHEQVQSMKRLAAKVAIYAAATAFAGALPLHHIAGEAARTIAEKVAHHASEMAIEKGFAKTLGKRFAIELDAEGRDIEGEFVQAVLDAVGDAIENLSDEDMNAILEDVAGGSEKGDGADFYVGPNMADNAKTVDQLNAELSQSQKDVERARQDALHAKTEGERLAAKAREDAATIASQSAQLQLVTARLAQLEGEKNDPQARADAEAARQAEVEDLIAVRADAKAVFATAADPDAKNWKADGKGADAIRREILATIQPSLKLDGIDGLTAGLTGKLLLDTQALQRRHVKELYGTAIAQKRAIDQARADAMAAVTGKRLDGEKGENPFADDDGDEAPNAEKARKDMIKRKKDSWKMSRKDRVAAAKC